MKNRYLFFAILVGAVIAIAASSFVRADASAHGKKYLVKINLNEMSVEGELNTETLQGWKFVQAFPESDGRGGIDLIFSR